ncbi:hypothetical protein R3P38DRAFT_2810532 [Favolaschia claudopus]|uniref:Uncharacterized protein n=1 Tax=Favolaschia claudopus TaxID=2862362 RepID=A0AAV9ZBE8_9AGAR
MCLRERDEDHPSTETILQRSIVKIVPATLTRSSAPRLETTITNRHGAPHARGGLVSCDQDSTVPPQHPTYPNPVRRDREVAALPSPVTKDVSSTSRPTPPKAYHPIDLILPPSQGHPSYRSSHLKSMHNATRFTHDADENANIHFSRATTSETTGPVILEIRRGGKKGREGSPEVEDEDPRTTRVAGTRAGWSREEAGSMLKGESTCQYSYQSRETMQRKRCRAISRYIRMSYSAAHARKIQRDGGGKRRRNRAEDKDDGFDTTRTGTREAVIEGKANDRLRKKAEKESEEMSKEKQDVTENKDTKEKQHSLIRRFPSFFECASTFTSFGKRGRLGGGGPVGDWAGVAALAVTEDGARDEGEEEKARARTPPCRPSSFLPLALQFTLLTHRQRRRSGGGDGVTHSDSPASDERCGGEERFRCFVQSAVPIGCPSRFASCVKVVVLGTSLSMILEIIGLVEVRRQSGLYRVKKLTKNAKENRSAENPEYSIPNRPGLGPLRKLRTTANKASLSCITEFEFKSLNFNQLFELFQPPAILCSCSTRD